MIRKTLVKPAFESLSPYWEIEITPDEIARELIRQDRECGVASGSIQRLAIDCARRKFKSKPFEMALRRLDFRIKFVYPEGFEGLIGTWGYDTKPGTIIRRWLERNPKIQGYTFHFVEGYADLPQTLGLSRPYRPLPSPRQVQTKDPYR